MAPPTKPQEQFMQELRDLFLSEGIINLTIGEIARRLGCSRRRLYEIAPTKEELFLKIAGETLAAVREAGWSEAAKCDTPAEKIEAYFSYGTSISKKMTVQFLRDIDSLPAGKKMFDDHMRVRIRGLEQFIVDGIDQEHFVPCRPRYVAETVFLVVKQLRDPEFRAACGVTLEEGFRELYPLLLYGLCGSAMSSRGMRRGVR